MTALVFPCLSIYFPFHKAICDCGGRVISEFVIHFALVHIFVNLVLVIFIQGCWLSHVICPYILAETYPFNLVITVCSKFICIIFKVLYFIAGVVAKLG